MENTKDLFLLNTLVNNFDYSKLRRYNLKDQLSYKRFTDQDYNARLLIDNFNKIVFFNKIYSNKSIGNYVAFTIEEYYNIYFKDNGPEFLHLQYSNRADFDARNGDIIIIDNDTNKEYHVDLKTSYGYLGCVSLGSLMKFNKDGYYLLIDIKNANSKFVSHKDVVDALKSGKVSLNAPSERKKYKGYPIQWNRQQLTSEYYIKGSDIAKL